MLPQAPIIQDTIKPILAIIETKEPDKPKEIFYTIQPNDNLTGIAGKTQTTVERLWAKNPEITDPDVIDINYQLKIPASDEILADRPIAAQKPPEPIKNNAPQRSVGSNESNTYAFGNCTHYSKERRPDLPNSLGNAFSWLYNAEAQGLPTGSTPRVGAIAVAASYGHVGYVEAIDGSRLLISEKNYEGFNIISQRWTNLSEWQGYVY